MDPKFRAHIEEAVAACQRAHLYLFNDPAAERRLRGAQGSLDSILRAEEPPLT